MNSNREWMYIRKIGGHIVPGFEEKVKEFVNFATSHLECMDGNKIKCPCNRCQNKPYLDPDLVTYHIVSNGFKSDYRRWLLHGEYVFQGGHESGGPSAYNNDNMYGYDSFRMSRYAYESPQDVPNLSEFNTYDRCQEMVMDAVGPTFEYPPNDTEPSNPDAQKFYDAMKEQQTPLYDGCTHSTLSAVTRLMNIKAEHGFSETCYDRIASLMYEIMPQGTGKASGSIGFFHVEDFVICLFIKSCILAFGRL